MANIEILYSDVNMRAGSNPAELVFNEKSVEQNILSIFETQVGSKWFRPTIGSNISRYLFEPIDMITAERIRFDMAQTLQDNGEFRVRFTLIEVLPDVLNEQYYVNIEYEAPELDQRKYTFQFNLSRGFS